MENGYEEGCTRGAFLCSSANKSLLKIMSQAYYPYVLYSSKHDRLYVGQTAKLKDSYAADVPRPYRSDPAPSGPTRWPVGLS